MIDYVLTKHAETVINERGIKPDWLARVGRKSETPSDAWMAADREIRPVQRPSQAAIVGSILYT